MGEHEKSNSDVALWLFVLLHIAAVAYSFSNVNDRLVKLERLHVQPKPEGEE
jgi:hypothetical protein